jgi:hypothetical protein
MFWHREVVFKLDALEIEVSTSWIVRTNRSPVRYVQNDVEGMLRQANRLQAVLREQKALEPSMVAVQVKTDLLQFKPNIPLLHVLCNKGQI